MGLATAIKTDLSSELHVITSEINSFKRAERSAAFEIGKRIKHVKENDLTHGQFTKWVEGLGYSPRTAQRYMKVYERFGDMEDAFNLPVSSLFEMLSLPSNIDAVTFLSDKHEIPTKGKRKAVADMTKTELRSVIKDIKEPDKPTHTPKATPATDFKQSKVSKIVGPLENLVDFFLEELKNGGINYKSAALIGSLSYEQQIRYAHLYNTTKKDYEYIELHVLLIREGVEDSRVLEIEQMLYKINSHIWSLKLHTEASAIIEEFEQTDIEDVGLSWVISKFERLSEIIEELIESARNNEYFSFDEDEDFIDMDDEVNKVDIYTILGVEKTATMGEIKYQYRHLMKVLHPDTGGSAYLFDIVKKSYDRYTDSIK